MTKKGVNGRAKGAAFERKVLASMEEWTGVKWTRTLLSGGGKEKGDICVVDGTSPWLVELKNREEFTYHQIFQYKATAPLWKWYDKLLKEQKVMGGKPIMLIAKANRKPAIIMVDHSVGLTFLKTSGINFHASLVVPGGKIVHFFLWDEIRDKVRVDVVETKKKTKRKGK